MIMISYIQQYFSPGDPSSVFFQQNHSMQKPIISHRKGIMVHAFSAAAVSGFCWTKWLLLRKQSDPRAGVEVYHDMVCKANGS